MPTNDADLRFKASLEDDVSPKVDRLEKKLKQMGATPSEIKMFLRAYDEATPKIKEAQKHIDQLPREHTIRLRANSDEAMNHIQKVQAEAKKPIQLSFVDNLKEIGDKLFSFRTRATMPLAGGIPGMNMLYGLGAGAGVLGGATAAVGMLKQSIEVNSQMEQSQVTLNQTLKDNTKAMQEMQKIVGIAQTTPFQYKDVLAADVRLRSYQIPTMPGEGGPKNQGWLKISGDMAAAMSTPITQAVEAIADARQGYFVRMMTYGIRMMREDFAAGGKYQGLTYEQGLAQAVKRFEGSQEMQSKTFQGLVSNLKDIMQQSLVKPIGAPAFEVAKSQAQKVQDMFMAKDAAGNFTPEAMQNQQKLARIVEKVQMAFVDLWTQVKKGKQYFQDYLQEPLTEIGKDIINIGKTFSQAFGKVMLETLKTVGEVILAISKPVLNLISKHEGLVQIYAIFKALSLLGFKGPQDGIKQILSSLNPLHASITGVIDGFHKMVSSTVLLGVALITKGFIDAAAAASNLETQIDRLGSKGQTNKGSKFMFGDYATKMQAEASEQAMLRAVSGTEYKNLTANALAGLPPGASPQLGLRQAGIATTLERDQGIDANEVNDLMRTAVKSAISEAAVAQARMGPAGSPAGAYSEKVVSAAQDQAARSIVALKTTTDQLNMSFKDGVRAMQMFAAQASQIGLGGLGGSPYVAAMSGTAMAPDFRISAAQAAGGVTSGNQLLRNLMESYNAPSVQMTRRIGFKNMPAYWNISPTERAKISSGTVTEQENVAGIHDTLAANIRDAAKSQAYINQVAPGVTLPDYANRGLLTQLQRLSNVQQISRGGPEAVSRARSQSAYLLEGQNERLAGMNTQLNEYNKQANVLAVAQGQVNLRMTAFQRTLIPLQRSIEDQQFAIQQYTLDALRPLERQMNRLSNASAELGNKMSNAQYDLNKFSSGLLDGEQAALGNLHALERYNKQLQLLQLSYSSIGTQLGAQVYEKGFSTTVKPLMGLSLALQQEQNQKRQQRAQLEYDLGYGEQHYQLQQAGRSRWQRTEMGFDQRLEGVRKNTNIIDNLTEAQHRLQNQQFNLSQKIFNVNEHLADQQDALSRLNQTLQGKTLSKEYREMADAQSSLAYKADLVNQKLSVQNIRIADVTAKSDLIKDIYKTMTDWEQDLLNPKGKGKKKGQYDSALALVNFGQMTGILTEDQATQLRDAVNKAGNNVIKARDAALDTRAGWIDIIKTGVKGAMTGDFWRMMGDRFQAVTGISAGPMPAVATFLTDATIAVIGVGMLKVLTKYGLLKGAEAAADRWGGPAGRGAMRAVEFLNTKFTGGFMEEMKDAFRVIKRGRSVAFGAAGALLGGAVAGPLGSLVGGLAGSQFGQSRTLRQDARNARQAARAMGEAGSAVKEGAKDIKGGAKRFAENVTRQGDKARFVVDEQGKVVDRFEETRKKLGLGAKIKNFGEHIKDFTSRVHGVGKFAAVVAVFAVVVGGLKSLIDLIPGVKKPHIAVPETPATKAAKEAKEAAKKTHDLIHDAGSAKNVVAVAREKGIDPHEAAGTIGKAVSYLDKHPALARAARFAGRGLNASYLYDIGSGVARGDARSIIEGGIGGAAGLEAGIRTARGGAGALGIGKAVFRSFIAKAFLPFMALDTLDLMKTFGIGDIQSPTKRDRPMRQYQYARGAMDASPWGDALSNPRISARERTELYQNYRQRTVLLDKLRTDAAKGVYHKKDYDRFWKLDQEYHDKFIDYSKDFYDRTRKMDQAHQDDLKKDREADHKKELDADDAHHKRKYHKRSVGWNAIYRLDFGWIKNVRLQVAAMDSTINSGSSSGGSTAVPGIVSDAIPGLAHGGLLKGNPYSVGPGRMVRVNEEGHDEVIIPLAPHRRNRAISLLRQTVGRLGGAHEDRQGYATGGMIRESRPGTDLAYQTARGAVEGALRAFANGGHTNIVNDAKKVLSGHASYWSGLSTGSDRKQFVRMSGGKPAYVPYTGKYVWPSGKMMDALAKMSQTGSVMINALTGGKHSSLASHHYSGTAVDLDISSGMGVDKIVQIAGQYGGQRNNESSHIHLDFPEGGAVGVDGAATAALIRLPRVPRGLLKQGSIGKRMFRILIKKRALWQAALRKQQQAAENANAGSGDAAAPWTGKEGKLSPGEAKGAAQKMMKGYGWQGSEWDALNQLWEHESNWRWNAGSVGAAYGIPQSMPGSKMASAGADWVTNAITQIKWGLKYIKDRYHRPSKAWAGWYGHNFPSLPGTYGYASGGMVEANASRYAGNVGPGYAGPSKNYAERILGMRSIYYPYHQSTGGTARREMSALARHGIAPVPYKHRWTKVSHKLLGALIHAGRHGGFGLNVLTGAHHKDPNSKHYHGLAFDVAPRIKHVMDAVRLFGGHVYHEDKNHDHMYWNHYANGGIPEAGASRYAGNVGPGAPFRWPNLHTSKMHRFLRGLNKGHLWDDIGAMLYMYKLNHPHASAYVPPNLYGAAKLMQMFAGKKIFTPRKVSRCINWAALGAPFPRGGFANGGTAAVNWASQWLGDRGSAKLRRNMVRFDDRAWCGDFAESAVRKGAGLSTGNWALTSNIISQAKSHSGGLRGWRPGGAGVNSASIGDLALFDWNADGNPNHVELIRRAIGSGVADTIGGNTGSPAAVRNHHRTANFLGVALVDYPGGGSSSINRRNVTAGRASSGTGDSIFDIVNTPRYAPITKEDKFLSWKIAGAKKAKAWSAADGWQEVGASMFTDHKGYKGDNLYSSDPSYAELGYGHYLGHLPYRKKLMIMYKNRIIQAMKLDIGDGGGSVRGHRRDIDLHETAAKMLGFPNGIDLVKIKKNFANGGLVPFAGHFEHGGSFEAHQPTAYIAGERGKEKIKVTPLSAAPGKRATWEQLEAYWKKSIEYLEDIKDKIRKTEKHLKDTKDAAEKKSDREYLRNLNAAMRAVQRVPQAIRRREENRVGRDVAARGDLTGGEGTVAAVAREKRLYQRVMRDAVTRPTAIRRAKKAVTTAKKKLSSTIRAARSRRSPGGTRITAAERRKIAAARRKVTTSQRRLRKLTSGAVGIAGKKVVDREDALKRLRARATSKKSAGGTRVTKREASEISKAVKALAAAQKGLRTAGRRTYLRSAAKRGISKKLVKPITGTGMTKAETKIFAGIQKSQAAAARRNELALSKLRGEARKHHSESLKQHKSTSVNTKSTTNHIAQLESTTTKQSKKTHQLLQALVAKDTVVNIHQVNTAVKSTTTRTPPRRRAR